MKSLKLELIDAIELVKSNSENLKIVAKYYPFLNIFDVNDIAITKLAEAIYKSHITVDTSIHYFENSYLTRNIELREYEIKTLILFYSHSMNNIRVKELFPNIKSIENAYINLQKDKNINIYTVRFDIKTKRYVPFINNISDYMIMDSYLINNKDANIICEYMNCVFK